MASVVKGKRPGQYVLPDEGKVVELVEQAENDQIDTIQVASGAITAGKTYLFFDVTANKNAQHSTFTTPHKLIGIDEFTLQSIGIALCQALGSTVADPNDLLYVAWAGSLQFSINRRPIVKGPLANFQAGIGVSGGVATTKNATTYHGLTNGVAATASIRKLKVEQPIVGETDVVNGSCEFQDDSWITGGSAMPTLTSTMGVMFIGHGIEKNGLGK